MKPILIVNAEEEKLDKKIQSTLNKLFEDLYNRAISNKDFLDAINAGNLATPVITKLTSALEGDIPYIYVYADPVPNASGYCWSLRKYGTDDYAQYMTTSNSNKFLSVGFAVTYEVRVQAIGQYFNSDWSATSLILTPAVGVMTPDPATNLTVTGMFKHLFLTWDNPDLPDIAIWEIWRANINDRSTAAKVGEAITTVFSDLIGTYSTTRYYWIRARATDGTYSAWYPANPLAGQSGTTANVTTTDYALLSVTNAIIADLAVDSAKIADLAVGTAKIAALAVSNAKIANLAVDTLQVAGNAVTYTKRMIMYNGSGDITTWPAAGGWWSTTITHNLGRRVVIQLALNGTLINVNNSRTYAIRTNGLNSFVIQVSTNWNSGTCYYDYW